MAHICAIFQHAFLALHHKVYLDYQIVKHISKYMYDNHTDNFTG